MTSYLNFIAYYASLIVLYYSCYFTAVYLYNNFFTQSVNATVIRIKDFLRKNIKLPSLFTFWRLWLTVPICQSIVLKDWHRAFWCTAFAGLFDVLDGFIARRLNQVTDFGAFFDAFADKVLISAIMWTFLGMQLPFPCLLLASLILVKEIVQLGASAYLFLRGRLKKVKPSFLGKASMFAQLMFALFLILNSVYSIPFTMYGVIAPVFVLLLASAVFYVVFFIKINQIRM